LSHRINKLETTVRDAKQKKKYRNIKGTGNEAPNPEESQFKDPLTDQCHT